MTIKYDVVDCFGIDRRVYRVIWYVSGKDVVFGAMKLKKLFVQLSAKISFSLISVKAQIRVRFKNRLFASEFIH